MATNSLPAPVRPANPMRGVGGALSKTTARAVEMARIHLRTGNPGAYARALSGEHRAASPRQQRAIEAEIAADACERLFTKHPANGCLIAREG